LLITRGAPDPQFSDPAGSGSKPDLDVLDLAESGSGPDPQNLADIRPDPDPDLDQVQVRYTSLTSHWSDKQIKIKIKMSPFINSH